MKKSTKELVKGIVEMTLVGTAGYVLTNMAMGYIANQTQGRINVALEEEEANKPSQEDKDNDEDDDDK